MEVNRYEKIWIGITIVAIALMLVATILAGFSLGVNLPGASGTVDPRTVAMNPPFDTPGVYELGAGKYQVIMLAKIWNFTPNEIKVPLGSEVSFKITSRDVTHGLIMDKTNVNVMILPGQIAEFTVTFKELGVYQFFCHEYCGTGHQAMAGKVIVE